MARRRSNMSLMRAGGNCPQEKNRVAAQAINNGSSSNGSVVRVRKFVGDDFDRYLGRFGLVKKTMPNTNGSSLYRAVCESLSTNQREYSALQQLVEDHLLFQYHIQRIEDGLPRVNKIEDSLTTVAHLLSYRASEKRKCGVKNSQDYRGDNEEEESLASLSALRQCAHLTLSLAQILGLDEGIDLIVYREINEKPVIYKGSLEGESAEKLTAILYEALYIGVFGFSRDTIKESIAKVREDMDAVGVDVETPTSDSVPGQPTEDFSSNDGSNQPPAHAWRPPIPYSSIKALDPSVYRNLSYDLFLKSKRQKGDYEQSQWFCFIDHALGIFRSGSPCLIMEGESCYRAFVLSVPDKHSRMVLVNGIERRVSVSRLLPLSCHISPIQTVPNSRFKINTEHPETAQTAPPRELFPWLSVVPLSYEYWTETFTVQCLLNGSYCIRSIEIDQQDYFTVIIIMPFQYLCQMSPNGFVIPNSGFAYVNSPWSYGGTVSSCESTSVVVGVPLDSSYECMVNKKGGLKVILVTHHKPFPALQCKRDLSLDDAFKSVGEELTIAVDPSDYFGSGIGYRGEE
ncbi:unnamed protein product [Haemonchus placei]|uniref:PPM-type phosphatase domain-containing protein n=1 Tax=Haemonchus placei TaxID=6290 RepID=A0A0N4W6G7_HAEPC|nr:unnamed protein product [Haemonchus placei]